MKKNLIRRDIVRRVVGSILASNLSSKELEMFANELVHSPELSFEIGHALRMAGQMLFMERPDFEFEDSQPESPAVISVLSKVQKMRLSKREVIDLMAMEEFFALSASALQRLPLSELINRFFEAAPKSKVNSFLRRIGIEGEQDPYLAGIEKR